LLEGFGSCPCSAVVCERKAEAAQPEFGTQSFLDLILICHLSQNDIGSNGAAAISEILPCLSLLRKLHLQ
jgi:hypothetical protein